MKPNSFSKIALSVLGLLLFALSLWAINNELRHYHPRDVLDSLLAIPRERLFLAIVFTILGYFTITIYDFLAFRYLNLYLSPVLIILTAFISYAISNTVGFAILTGGGIRYRLYSHWGISPTAITKIIALGNLSFWVGLLAVGGSDYLTTSPRNT